MEVSRVIDKEKDSIYIFSVEREQNIKKEIIGIEKNYDDIIL